MLTAHWQKQVQDAVNKGIFSVGHISVPSSHVPCSPQLPIGFARKETGSCDFVVLKKLYEAFMFHASSYNRECNTVHLSH